MKTAPLWVLLAFEVLFVTAASYAGCPTHKPRVVDVQITSCQTLSSLAQQTRECLQLPWLKFIEGTMLERATGLIVRGKITDSREVTFSPNDVVVGPRSSESEEGIWFLTKLSLLNCDLLPHSAQLYLTPRCCDVMPPLDAQCWFGIDAIDPVPGVVRYSMEQR